MSRANGTTHEVDLDAARAHLKEEGWVAVPNILDAAKTKEVLNRLWAAAEAANKRGEDTHLSFLDPNASNVRVFYLLEHDAIFRELIEHPLAVQLVKSVLGDDYIISNFTANVARPGSKSMGESLFQESSMKSNEFKGLHSDQSLVTPDPWTTINALNVIWCLHDVYFENGATLYIPGSNKWERREDIPRDAKQKLKPFEAKAGSIIVMDGRVWHTSGANITKDQDRALLFVCSSLPFRT
jgi:ectoine hydroxylase-related dioxygenase (phytanoyl-CoA dioxygenase family)